jgi:hypothetical protein
MSRLGLLATFSALILTGCVSSYTYRDGPGGGDYYYAEPQIQYRDVYGMPYAGLGYDGGWYGRFGYGFGYGALPYSHYGFPYWGGPYGYYGGAFGYYGGFYPPAYWHHRPHRPRPPGPLPPGTLPPGVIVDPPGTPNPGDIAQNGIGQAAVPMSKPAPRPRWRVSEPGRPGEPLSGAQPRMRPMPGTGPSPGQPGGLPMPQERPRRPMQESAPAFPRRMERPEMPRPSTPPAGRIERREREPGLNPTP